MEETKLYIGCVVSGGHWHKPDYSSYTFISDEPITREVADQEQWEEQCDTASSYDQEFEECSACNGEGCEECDFNGGWDEEWGEHVERHTSSWIEEYNPKIHYEVPSKRPEHLLWKAQNKVEVAKRKFQTTSNKIAEVEATLKKLKEQHDQECHELIVAGNELTELRRS